MAVCKRCGGLIVEDHYNSIYVCTYCGARYKIRRKKHSVFYYIRKDKELRQVIKTMLIIAVISICIGIMLCALNL